MIIYIKCYDCDPDIPEYFSALLEREGYQGGKLDTRKYYAFKIEDPTFKMVYNELPSGIEESYLVTISSIEEAIRACDIITGKELARFNSNKPRFTFIDFRLFEDMDEGVDHINQIGADIEDYCEEIIYTLSAIAFDDDVLFQLKRLQALSYKLSLTCNNISKDPESDVYDLSAFEDMARVLEFGAKKYARNNWRKGTEDPLSSGDSLYRHIKDMMRGEMIDPDSGLPHIGHVMCNVMFLTYHLTKKDEE